MDRLAAKAGVDEPEVVVAVTGTSMGRSARKMLRSFCRSPQPDAGTEGLPASKEVSGDSTIWRGEPGTVV